VLAFRRWLDDYGGGGPWGGPDAALLAGIGPRQGRDALLDRQAGAGGGRAGGGLGAAKSSRAPPPVLS
jgi:hypothetical protein